MRSSTLSLRFTEIDPSGQDLKIIYLARATRGHRNQGVLTQFHISNFREVESFGFRKCPRDFLELLLCLKRQRFLPTRVISNLKAI